MAHVYINNHNVSYDDKSERVRLAVYYLQYIISRDDAEALFKEAKTKEGSSSAHFKDNNFRKFKLKRRDGEYILLIREE